MFQFEYQIGDDKYLDFLNYQIKHDKAFKLLLRIISLLIILRPFFILISSYAEYEDTAALLKKTMISILVAIVTVIIMRLVAGLIVSPINRLQITHMEKKGELPYGDQTTVSFGEDYYVTSTAEITTRRNYSMIDRIADNHDIYLYTNTLSGLIIPEYVFESKEQKNSFLAYINKKVESAKTTA